MRFVYVRACGAVVVCLLSCLVVSPVFGGFTNINPPASGEKSIKQILEHVYGGSFLKNGEDYDNGPITAVRINDTANGLNTGPVTPLALIYDAGVLNSGQVTDQIWSADSVDADARARFAMFSQKFGFSEGVTDAIAYQHLMNVNGSGFDQTGTASLDNMSNRVWRWARDGENGVFTSQNSDNSDGVDHMITFRIDFQSPSSGGGDETTYLLFFEDKRVNQSSDFDFNDMVVEIRARSVPAPEPTSLGLLAVSSLLSLRRNRRRP